MARKDIEIVDEGDDVETQEDTRGKKRQQQDTRDDQEFDELEHNIQFPEDDDLGTEREKDDERDSRDDQDENERDDEDDEDEEREDDEERGERRQRRGADYEDGDDEGMPDKFRRRLARERRLREEAEDDANAYQAQFERVNKQIAEISAKVDGQQSTAQIDAKIADLNGQLDRVKTDLAAAMEAGDTKKQIELQDRLSDIKADLKLAERDKAAAKVAKPEGKTDDATATPVENRHKTRWMRQHGRKFRSDPVFAAAAAAISREVAQDGVAPTSSRHFEEVDRQLVKRFPEEYPNIRRQQTTKGRRPPVSADGDAPGPRQRETRDPTQIKVRGGKATLTERHKTLMRKFGMDPDNKADRETFVRENLQIRKR